MEFFQDCSIFLSLKENSLNGVPIQKHFLYSASLAMWTHKIRCIAFEILVFGTGQEKATMSAALISLMVFREEC